MNDLRTHIRVLRMESLELLSQADVAEADGDRSKERGGLESARASYECSLMMRHLSEAKKHAAERLETESMSLANRRRGTGASGACRDT